jgi:hypothetical protein
LLFSDGSVLALAQGTDIGTAFLEAAEHDAGVGTAADIGADKSRN